MAEYVGFQSILGENEVVVTVYFESSTSLPVRVEVRGVAGRYRFIVISPDRTRTFTTTFDSETTVSRNIPNAIASRYQPTWNIGVEGV